MQARILLGVLALLYPLLVYLGLQHFPLPWVSLGLATLLLVRMAWLYTQPANHSPLQQAMKPALLLALVCTLLSWLLNNAGALTLIPTVINLACLTAFVLTLRQPPSMIERFARLYETDMDARAIAYTRRVTQVWCLFFIFNGSVALYTALFSSLHTWTLYNGLIAYLLMGLLFAGEYLVRQRVKAQHRIPH